MTGVEIAVVAGLGLVVGVLTGLIGIGGVLIVPTLVFLLGHDVHAAIASSLAAMLFSGLVGVALYARRGTLRWHDAAWLCAGAAPGAWLGATAALNLQGRTLELLIAVMVVLSGVNALRGRGRGAAAAKAVPLPGAGMAAIGLAVGIGSAMSGTAGPLLLMPVLVWLRVGALAAVGLGQVVHLPVTGAASLANLGHGVIDLALVATMALPLMAGVPLGGALAHALSAEGLRRVVAWSLVVVGALVLLRASLGETATGAA